MNEDQLMQTAHTMFFAGKGRKEVIDFFTENGVEDATAEAQATKAYLAVKPALQAATAAEEPEEEGGMGGILLGALLLVGGLVATKATDRIRYGAMGVGVITIFSSMAKKMK